METAVQIIAPSYEEITPLVEAAENRYREESLEAWCGLEEDICGIEVRPFTPRAYLELELAGNALFVTGRPIEEADIFSFLWRISTSFVRNNGTARDRFIARVVLNLARHPEWNVEAQIAEYFRKVWAGRPGGKSSSNASPTVKCWISQILHTICANYGWSEDAVLDRSFRTLFQSLHRCLEAADPDYKETCVEASRIKAEWLQAVNTGKGMN